MTRGDGSLGIWTGKKWHCQHNRQRGHCKDCGGTNICEHNRQRNNCKDCGGASICIHGRQRVGCKHCDTKMFCIHQKVKRFCVECGGKGLCIHGKRKPKCIECGGTSICEHKRQRHACKECEGSSICEHKRQRSLCRECKGTNICDHGRSRNQCIPCGGSQICVHKRQLYSCKVCKGAGVCEHGRNKVFCVDCEGKNICQTCKVTQQSNPQYKPHCARCYYHLHPEAPPSRRFKTKESYLYQALLKSFPTQPFIYDKQVDGGCSLKRPDFRWECLTHTVIVECDETQHANYSCENKRTMQLFTDCGSRPLVLIRFNPDSYVDHNNKRVKPCFTQGQTCIVREGEWNKRYAILQAQINTSLTTIPNKEITEVKLFYTTEDDNDCSAIPH